MDFKALDYEALSAFYDYRANKNRNEFFLEVVGEGHYKHLECVSKNWFGRFLMWLGWGSASMYSVSNYIQEVFERSNDSSIYPDADEEQLERIRDVEYLKGKLDKHYIGHITLGMMSRSSQAASVAYKILNTRFP